MSSQWYCKCNIFYVKPSLFFHGIPKNLTYFMKKTILLFNVLSWMYLNHKMPFRIKLKLLSMSFELRKLYFQPFTICGHCAMVSRTTWDTTYLCDRSAVHLLPVPCLIVGEGKSPILGKISSISNSYDPP